MSEGKSRRPCPVHAVRDAVSIRDCRLRGEFLPTAGNRNVSDVNNVGSNGNYWSSTPNGTNNAYNLNFNSGNVNPANNNNRNNGNSVRLVCAAQPFCYILML